MQEIFASEIRNTEYWALTSRIPLKKESRKSIAENQFQTALTAFTLTHATTGGCSSLKCSISMQI